MRVRVPPPAPTRSEHDIISEKIEKKSYLGFQSNVVYNKTNASGIRTVWLLRVIWDHEIAGSNPAFRTRLEPVLISLLWEPLYVGSSPAFPTIIGK